MSKAVSRETPQPSFKDAGHTYFDSDPPNLNEQTKKLYENAAHNYENAGKKNESAYAYQMAFFAGLKGMESLRSLPPKKIRDFAEKAAKLYTENKDYDGKKHVKNLGRSYILHTQLREKIAKAKNLFHSLVNTENFRGKQQLATSVADIVTGAYVLISAWSKAYAVHTRTIDFFQEDADEPRYPYLLGKSRVQRVIDSSSVQPLIQVAPNSSSSTPLELSEQQLEDLGKARDYFQSCATSMSDSKNAKYTSKPAMYYILSLLCEIARNKHQGETEWHRIGKCQYPCLLTYPSYQLCKKMMDAMKKNHCKTFDEAVVRDLRIDGKENRELAVGLTQLIRARAFGSTFLYDDDSSDCDSERSSSQSTYS